MEMNIFLIIMHIALLPMVFHLLKHLRIEDMFKRRTPPNVITLLYLVLTIAITQLVIQYFTTVFTLIQQIF